MRREETKSFILILASSLLTDSAAAFVSAASAIAATAAAFVAAAWSAFWLRASTDSVVGATVVPVDVEAAGVDPAVEEDGEHAGLHLGGTKPRSLTLTLPD